MNKTTVVEAKRFEAPKFHGYVPGSAPQHLVRRAVFDHAGRRHVAIETTLHGQFEVYAVDSTGLEMFLGFLPEVARRAPALAMAAVEALATV